MADAGNHDETSPLPESQATSSLGKPSPQQTVHAITRLEAQEIVGDRYRIESEAKAGGMGRVFRAIDNVLQREVAIKMLHPLPAREAEAERNRLLNEARAMAKLRHPCLCPVHEVALDAQVPFIVMDWIDGIALDEAWRTFNTQQRLEILTRLVDAVSEMHRRELVHGDLKPQNILVDRHGQPIVVDFGLSSGSVSAAGDDASGRTQRGGTPGCAPPEQFDPSHPISPCMDVYAIGVMLYQLLTDRKPYEGTKADEILAQMRRSDPSLPEQFAPDAPWPLQRISLVALERDPGKRYPDAHTLHLDLQRFMRGESVAARPSSLARSFRERIDTQLEDAERWRRQGLVTEHEHNRLSQLLSGFLRPESHWILDCRRLTISQVTLYLGGWLVVLAMSVGVALSWDALSAYPVLRYIIACVTAGGMIGFGLLLQSLDHRRVALGYQITGCLLVPVAVWLVLKETGWLGAPMVETVPLILEGSLDHTREIAREWIQIFGLPLADEFGLLNRQVLVIALCWLVAAAALRLISASSALTPLAVVAGGVAAAAGWASAGLLSDDPRDVAHLGLWLAIVGTVAVAPGLLLNHLEQRQIISAGWARARRRDAWAVLSGALALIVIGLSVTAWHAGDLYTLGLLDDSTDPSTRAWAFMINGVALQVLSLILSRQRTLLRERLAEIIRWLTPMHFLTAMAVLQVDAEGGMWLVWLIALVIGAGTFAYLSVLRQWKPFLVTGMSYLAVAYVLGYREAFDRLAGDAQQLVELMLLFLVLIGGVVLMVLAWKIPDWRSRRQMEG